MNVKYLRFMIELGLIVAVAATAPVVAEAAVRFEFLNLDTNAVQSTFPLGAKNEIILRSDDTNLSQMLPIAIVIQADKTRYKNAIPNNPALACANEFMCSVAGPVIPAATKYMQLQASVTSGEVLATYTFGAPAPDAAPLTTAIPKKAAVSPLKTVPSITPAIAPEPSLFVAMPADLPTATPRPKPGVLALLLNICIPLIPLLSGLLLIGIAAYILHRPLRALFNDATPNNKNKKSQPNQPKKIPKISTAVPPSDQEMPTALKPAEMKSLICNHEWQFQMNGRCYYNVPFMDEYGMPITIDHWVEFPELAAAMIEAMRAGQIYDLAKKDCRQRALKLASRICAERNACPGAQFCKAELIEEKYDPPPGQIDPKNPPPFDAKPQIGAAPPKKAELVPDWESPQHRYRFWVNGKFRARCFCAYPEPSIWKKIGDWLFTKRQ